MLWDGSSCSIPEKESFVNWEGRLPPPPRKTFNACSGQSRECQVKCSNQQATQGEGRPVGLVGGAVREVLDAGAQVPGGLQKGKRRGPFQASASAVPLFRLCLEKLVIYCHKCSLHQFLLFLVGFAGSEEQAEPDYPASCLGKCSRASRSPGLLASAEGLGAFWCL